MGERSAIGLATIACMLLVACGSPSAPGMAPDGGLDVTGSDGIGQEIGMSDGPGDSNAGLDGTLDGGGGDGDVEGSDDASSDAIEELVCAAQAFDAGAYSSLATLPVAELCAGAYGNLVSQSVYPCQGTFLVEWNTCADCTAFLVYDARTGALVAGGGGLNGNLGCGYTVPGFQFPYQCLNNPGWWPDVNLCADGGPTDAAVTDGAGDAPD